MPTVDADNYYRMIPYEAVAKRKPPSGKYNINHTDVYYGSLYKYCRSPFKLGLKCYLFSSMCNSLKNKMLPMFLVELMMYFRIVAGSLQSGIEKNLGV